MYDVDRLIAWASSSAVQGVAASEPAKRTRVSTPNYALLAICIRTPRAPFNSETKLSCMNRVVKMVSDRYYFIMLRKRAFSACAVAELVAQLGRIAYGEGFAERLTPAQWTAIRYFARANRVSRTASAFAEFHATTRGTASQTLKGLVAQGYLTRTRSEADGRSARLDLTDKARVILTDDPFEALVRAAGTLPPSARGRFARTLERMLGRLAQERGKRPFGTCPSCEHLARDDRCPEREPSYRCGFLRAPLDEAELDQLCINFAPCQGSAMHRAFSGGDPR